MFVKNLNQLYSSKWNTLQFLLKIIWFSQQLLYSQALRSLKSTLEKLGVKRNSILFYMIFPGIE